MYTLRMCGIAGLVRLDGSPVDPGELDRLTAALSHRGPDGQGTMIAGNAGLGQRRLKIIDLSEAAAQPMRSDDGQVLLTFNGEIYDFQAERSLLEAKGHRFRSTGDTEVLLHLYLEYGPACVDMLRGMFAFAIVDLRSRTLFLARDRFGKKPLKYFRENGVFAFASELKALRTHPACPRSVDTEAVHHFLSTMYLPSPLTGFSGIKKLPAAHTLMLNLDTGEETLRRYWKPTFAPDRSVSAEDWKARIVEELDQSVRLRMIADVPVGAFLSGGVDSAAVVALMARHSPHPVKTFSIGSDDPRFDESEAASAMAKAIGTDHHAIPLQADIVRLLPELVAAYEEPFAEPSVIPTYLVSRETRKHVTVALNGDGGDENFAGYVRYPILRFSEKWRRSPLPLALLARFGTDILWALRRDQLAYRARRFQATIHLPLEQRYLQYLSFFTEEEKRALEAGGTSFPRTDEWFARRTAEARTWADPGDLVHTAIAMDVDTYLADDLLPKVDLGSMAHGLEARSPFLDHVFFEMTAKIPAKYKLRGRTRKWILKQALQGIVPEDTLTRPKRGFRVPLDRWFRGDCRAFVRDRVLEGHPEMWNILDRGAVERWMDGYLNGHADASDHAWALLWLGEWYRQYS